MDWCCRTGLNCRPPPYQGGALPLSYGSLSLRGKGARRDGGSFAIGSGSTQGQKTPITGLRGNSDSTRTMSKTEQAALRDQRLAAKLRENLKRRKGQAKARAQSEAQAPDPTSAPEPVTVKKP